MQGPPEQPGVNPRSLFKLFKTTNERAKRGWTFETEVAMLEIYNEKVRDLIGENQTALEIRGNDTIKGLVWTRVKSVEEVMTLMARGEKHRAVGVHNMNDRSSRSHLVLQVRVSGKNKATNAWHRGKLHLIDLAGSERVGKTDAKGERLREAQNINKSLSALGNVISALALKRKHVPFRDSKLTFLLRDSLGGDSKVLMFVNCSPVLWNSGETVCSLNFAKRCRSVQLGAATKNSSNPEIVKLRREVAELKDRLDGSVGSSSRLHSGSGGRSPSRLGATGGRAMRSPARKKR
jgi:kinesin family member C2/C3